MPGSFNKIFQFKSRLAGLPVDARWHLGLDGPRINNEKGSRILVYHGVCPGNHLRFNTLFVKLRSFEDQLKLYKKYFNIVSLDDFFQQKFSKEKFNVTLTFDDGFANNYKYVLPLLEQYQVPATFFITGIREAGYDILWNDFLAIAGQYGPANFSFRNETFYKDAGNKYMASRNGERLVDILRLGDFEMKAELIKTLGTLNKMIPEDYWLQMTPGQIKILSGSKWATVGSHSYFHNDLAKIGGDLQKIDIVCSKRYLEKITGMEIKALAFPYGSYTGETIKIVKEAGFRQLLATEFLFPGDTADSSLRERLTINPFISNINQLYASIRGNYK